MFTPELEKPHKSLIYKALINVLVTSAGAELANVIYCKSVNCIIIF